MILPWWFWFIPGLMLILTAAMPLYSTLLKRLAKKKEKHDESS